jgi:hypothetical protein
MGGSDPRAHGDHPEVWPAAVQSTRALSAKDKTWFRRDNQAAYMFARRIRKEAKPRCYRLSPAQMRVIDGLARAAMLTANAPSTPGSGPHRRW